MMLSPLVRNMIETHNYPILNADTIETFLQSHENTMLFLVGDTDSFPEGNDVAIILPELMKLFSNRLNVAVVGRDIEREVQLRYRIKGWPSLLMLRYGAYLGVITRVQDWEVYLNEIHLMLEKTPTEPPPLDITHLCNAMR